MKKSVLLVLSPRVQALFQHFYSTNGFSLLEKKNNTAPPLLPQKHTSKRPRPDYTASKHKDPSQSTQLKLQKQTRVKPSLVSKLRKRSSQRASESSGRPEHSTISCPGSIFIANSLHSDWGELFFPLTRLERRTKRTLDYSQQQQQ